MITLAGLIFSLHILSHFLSLILCTRARLLRCDLFFASGALRARAFHIHLSKLDVLKALVGQIQWLLGAHFVLLRGLSFIMLFLFIICHGHRIDAWVFCCCFGHSPRLASLLVYLSLRCPARSTDQSFIAFFKTLLQVAINSFVQFLSIFPWYTICQLSRDFVAHFLLLRSVH